MPSPSWRMNSKKSSSALSPSNQAFGKRLFFSHHERTGHPSAFFVSISLVNHLLQTAYFTAMATATQRKLCQTWHARCLARHWSSFQSPTYAQTPIHPNPGLSCHHGNGCRHLTRIQPRRSPCAGCGTCCSPGTRRSASLRSGAGSSSGTRRRTPGARSSGRSHHRPSRS